MSYLNRIGGYPIPRQETAVSCIPAQQFRLILRGVQEKEGKCGDTPHPDRGRESPAPLLKSHIKIRKEASEIANCVGRKLGNYRLVRLLGQGGFGEVYLGEHIYLETPAAIKILYTQLTMHTLDDFLKEAQTLARLEHPHIVRVLEFGMEDQMAFLVMNYAPNGTLRQQYPDGALLPPDTIVQYMKQAASALQYAHDHDVIHRDIKPENMLLGRNNELLLSDFGIAVVTENSQQFPDRAGTANYMAPEQLYGNPCMASDQYALAVVVYEWFCGALPFKGPDRDISIQHAQFLPLSLQEMPPTIPPAVGQVVLKALAKNPQQRFPSVQDFADALEQAYITTLSITLPSIAKADYLQASSPLYYKVRHSTTSDSGTSECAPQVRVRLSTSEPDSFAAEYQNPPPSNYSLPSPADIQSTRPFPTHQVRAIVPAKPSRRLSRRLFVAGLIGLAVAGSTISWELLSQKQLGAHSTSSSTATSMPITISKPPLASPSPQSQAEKLTVQIINIPPQVNKNDSVNVGVLTNASGVRVTLHAYFTSSGHSYTSQAQTTDRKGNATLVWTIHERKAKGATAIVTITAVDPKGRRTTSPSKVVQVG